jgi:hypothetical protein
MKLVTFVDANTNTPITVNLEHFVVLFQAIDGEKLVTCLNMLNGNLNVAETYDEALAKINAA